MYRVKTLARVIYGNSYYIVHVFPTETEAMGYIDDNTITGNEDHELEYIEEVG